MKITELRGGKDYKLIEFVNIGASGGMHVHPLQAYCQQYFATMYAIDLE